MANINKIKLSGTSYDIQDSNAARSVTLTQAEYDVLQTKDPNVFYIISDSSISYMTSADTESAITQAVSGKQDTLSAGTNITIVDNVISAEGGSITIDPSLDSGSTNAVANSTITEALSGKQNKLTATGWININESYNRISTTLPIYQKSKIDGIYTMSVYGNNINYPNNVTGKFALAVGDNNTASGNYSLAYGGFDAYGDGCSATSSNSVAIGRGNLSSGFCTIAKGYKNKATNQYEESGGRFNLSNKANTTWGDSGNTLFSVGNGTADNARHNAFEIRQNGDIYITSGGTDIKLQDNLGGGGASYSAGTGIDITNDVISVTGKVDTTTYETYTAATATAIGDKLATSDFNTYSGTVDTAINSKASQNDLSTLSGTVTAHTASTTIHVTAQDKTNWNNKSDFSGDYNDLVNKPTIPTVPTSNTAFTNDAGYITIDATSGKVDTSTYNTYTAATDTALASKADTATTYTKTEVDTALASKQTTLTAGTNITIVDNVISAEGGGSITIDPTLDSGSTNPVANSAITKGFDDYTIKANNDNGEVKYFYFSTPSNPWGSSTLIRNFSINGRCPLTKTNGSNSYIDKFSLVETSAITTAITSSSTDVQVPSAKAVNDKLGGLSLVKLTQAQYDALTTKDSNTLYVING